MKHVHPQCHSDNHQIYGEPNESIICLIPQTFTRHMALAQFGNDFYLFWTTTTVIKIKDKEFFRLPSCHWTEPTKLFDWVFFDTGLNSLKLAQSNPSAFSHPLSFDQKAQGEVTVVKLIIIPITVSHSKSSIIMAMQCFHFLSLFWSNNNYDGVGDAMAASLSSF